MTLSSTTTNTSQSKTTNASQGSPMDPKDRAELKEVISLAPSFRWLSEQHIDALISTARIERFPAEQVLEKEGATPTRLSLILKGDVDAFWGEALREVVASMTRGGVFGSGLVLDQPNLFSFATNRETVAASWDDAALRRAESLAPGLRFQLGVRLSKNLRLAEYAELLQHAPLFRGSSSVLRHRLLQEMTLLQFPAGTSIYKRGDAASACYLVVRGEVEVKQEASDGQPERIIIVGRGALLGDIDLFASGTRAETAQAIGDTEVLAIDRIDMEALRRACGSFRRAIAARVGGKAAAKPQDLILIVNRTSHGARSVASLIRSAFSDAGEKDVEILEIAPQGQASSAGKDVLALPSDPEAALQALDERALRVGARYVVLYTGIKGAMEWLTEPVWDKLINHRVSAAVYFTDDLRRAFPIETPQLAPVQYVEVHASSSKQDTHTVRSGSIRLVIDDPRGSDLRYESLAPANRTALQRLARRLSHQAVGVALGGGSAWGFAHVALLRALHEAGIPIDIVAGTSMGSVVACAYGSRQLEGLDSLIKHSKELALRISVAPFTRKPVESFIEKKLLAHKNLQDMPLPTFPVAVDIQTGRARVFRHGRAAYAMFASTAMPMLFVPEIWDGVRYVDGGIANNVPVSALVEEGADFIIASNVIPPPNRMAREAHKTSLTRIFSQLNPLSRAQDGLRSMFLLMHEAGTRQATAAQVMFAPSMGKFGLFDLHAAKEIVAHVQPELPRFIEIVKEQYRAFCRNRD
jgi:predicted acylesterase/phospholipase RssA/CRP-like cAMP-binding protein